MFPKNPLSNENDKNQNIYGIYLTTNLETIQRSSIIGGKTSLIFPTVEYYSAVRRKALIQDHPDDLRYYAK